MLFALVYAFGLVRRHGLLDGFGHVIGGDLLAFRTGAIIVAEGNGARLYDFALQTAHQKAIVSPDLKGILPFTSPPFVALAYLPFVPLPHGVAFALWTLLSLACIPIAFRLFRPLAPRTTSYRRDLALLTLSFAPLLEGLAAGSSSTVSLPIYAAALAALATGRDATAGALFGLLLFRVQLLFAPLALLAWKRRWRALAGFAAVGVVLCVLSEVFIDPGTLFAWLRLLPLLSRMIFEPGEPTAIFSSVHAIFLIPLGPAHFELGVVLGTIAAVALLAALLWLWSGPWQVEGEDFRLRCAALIVVAPLVAEYTHLHDLTILALAGVLLVEEGLRRPDAVSMNRTRIVLGLLWVSCMIAPAVVSRVAPIQLAPIAALVLAWTIARAARRVAAQPPVREGQAARCQAS